MNLNLPEGRKIAQIEIGEVSKFLFFCTSSDIASFDVNGFQWVFDAAVEKLGGSELRRSNYCQNVSLQG
jgi:hypothetical protein